MLFIKSVLILIMCMSSNSFADKIKLLEKNDEALQARADIIANAKEEIFIEYFAFSGDDFSLTNYGLLRAAAERGVRIKILVDSLSNKLSLAQMAAILGVTENSKAFKNIEMRLFNPLQNLNLPYQTFRNHDKLLNIDGKYMIIGGRNTADNYFGKSTVFNYKDADALISGESAEVAKNYFLTLWDKNPAVKKLNLYQYSQSNVDYPNCSSEGSSRDCGTAEQEIKTILARTKSLYENFKAGSFWIKSMPLSTMLADMEEVGPIQFLFNDPTLTMRNVSNKLVSQILSIVVDQARESVLITTPYLYPTVNQLETLRVLASRGIKIQIVTNSLSTTDSLLSHAGFLSIKKQLAEMGVEVYLYKGPETLHTKGIVVDGKISFIGSANFDERSAETNREIEIAVGDTSRKITEFSKKFSAYIKNELIGNSVLATIDGQEMDLTAFDASVSKQKKANVRNAKPFIKMLKNQL